MVSNKEQNLLELVEKFSFNAEQFPANEVVISKKKAIQLIKRACKQ